MESKIFQCGLPEETIELITQRMGGKRVRITKPTSKHNPIFRKKRDKNICIEYEQGKSIDEIASQINLNKSWVWRILKGNNIEIRGKNGKSLTANIEALHKLGYKKNQIAEKLEISRPTVYAHLRKLGIK